MILAAIDRMLSGRISKVAFALGSQAYERGDLPAARRYLSIVAAAAPRDAMAQGRLARTAFDAGDAQAALAMIEAALRLEPQNSEFFALAIAAQHALGDAAGALRRGAEALARCAGRDPGFVLMDVIAQLRLPGPRYPEVLRAIHAQLRPATYVEIGVANGESIVLAQPGTRAIGVDPEPIIAQSLPPETTIHAETSDDFFARNNVRALLGDRPVELAFIDGMHLFEYALRDFINLEKLCTARSTILVHDTYPFDGRSAERARNTVFWSGDIWRLIVALKKHRPELRINTIAAAPTGLTVIRNLDPASNVLAAGYEAIVRECMALDYSHIASDQPAMLNLTANDPDSLRRLLQ
jgi:tetratricopeptide (TPR) repeat protein